MVYLMAQKNTKSLLPGLFERRLYYILNAVVFITFIWVGLRILEIL